MVDNVDYLHTIPTPCGVSAILYLVPIHCIGTYNSVALTCHPTVDNISAWHSGKGVNFKT